MRKFIYKILTFTIILYVSLLLIDYGYSAIIRRSNYRPVEAWEDVIAGNIQSEIVVSGSSRAWVQIDPYILDSVLCSNSYNLGMNGSQINRQVQKYNVFRKRNPAPKVIIQNIDAWSLKYEVGYEKEQFFPFFWYTDIREMFFKSEPFTFFEKYIPFYRYHGLNPKLFLQKEPRSLYKGYQGQDDKWNGEAYRRQDSIKFIVNDSTLCMFDSFLKQTKEDSIKVVFVYTPLFYGATKKITNNAEMHYFYQGLADQYGIPVLDYSNLWICRDTAYFYNAMHVNRAGAQIFTDSLANDIKRLGIIQ